MKTSNYSEGKVVGHPPGAAPYRQGRFGDKGFWVFCHRGFKGITGAQAHFLSRLKYGVSLYNRCGKLVWPATLLRRKGIIDMQVLIGKQRLPVRLVMLPLPNAQTADGCARPNTTWKKDSTTAKSITSGLHTACL